MNTPTTCLVLAAALLLGGCAASKAPCAICYEDEWSREPFPGQTKQHLPVLTPDDLKRGAPVSTREFLGESAGEGY